MNASARPVLVSPALPLVEVIEQADSRGLAGASGYYLSADGAVDARLVTLVKLSDLWLDERSGIAATGDRDATAAAITSMFDAVASRLPRERWKPDLDAYLEDHQQFNTWTPGNITLNDEPQDAYRLAYGDAGAHVTDLGDTYLVVVTLPAIDVPEVRWARS